MRHRQLLHFVTHRPEGILRNLMPLDDNGQETSIAEPDIDVGPQLGAGSATAPQKTTSVTARLITTRRGG